MRVVFGKLLYKIYLHLHAIALDGVKIGVAETNNSYFSSIQTSSLHKDLSL